MIRKYCGVILILGILYSIPAVAAGVGSPDQLMAITGASGNESLLANASVAGVNVVYKEPEPLITLLRIESNETSFPGPRSMAFGPRWIGFSAGTRTLLVVATVLCIAVLAFILFRWKIRDKRKDEL